LFEENDDGFFSNNAGKLFNSLMVASAFKALVWNPGAQVANFLAGQFAVITHATQKDKGRFLNKLLFFSPDSYIVGVYRMTTHAMKCYHIMKRTRLVDITQEDRYDGLSMIKKKFDNFAFLLTTRVEQANHGVAFMGMMSQKEWDSYDSKGRVKTVENGWSKEASEAAAKNKMSDDKIEQLKFEAYNMQGDYGPENSAIWTYSIGGRLFMQYKRWMPAFFMARLGSGRVDMNGNFQRGFYTSSMAYIHAVLYNMKSGKSQQEIYNDTLDMKGPELVKRINMLIKEAEGGNIKFSEMSKTDRKNMVKIFRELTMMAIFWASFIRSGDDDDEKKKTAREKYYDKNIFTRAWQDMIIMWNFDTYQGLVENIMPALTYLIDVGRMIGEGGMWAYEEAVDTPKKERTSLYKKDSPPYGYKDEPKVINRFLKVMPAGSAVYQFKQFFNAMDEDAEKERRKSVNDYNTGYDNQSDYDREQPERDTSPQEFNYPEPEYPSN
jgi:hypothetical protein